MKLHSLFIALLLPFSAFAQQPRHEIVRGRVISDAGTPVSGADVIVTRTSDQSSQTARTDAAGAYSTDWPAGTGDYALLVNATGFQRFTAHLARTASDSVVVGDAHLVSSAQRLARVVTQATRPVPDRDPLAFGAGSIEGSTAPQNAARRLGPDLSGDLAAIAAMLPGIALTPSGISVQGLASSQNAVTLGGLAFAGADIPRDAATRVRVQTSSYDPSNGWFSGAQTAVDLSLGDQFTSRTAHLTADAPALQYNDPVSARLGQRFTNLNGSLGGNGQLVDDRWAYNYGLQGGRKTYGSSPSLLTADADLLQHAGVSPDSVNRFLSLLRQAGIPVSAGGIPRGTIDDNVSFIARVDHAPYDWTKLAYNPASYGLQAYAKWGRTQAQGLSPIGTPAHGGASTTAIGSLTGLYSLVFGQNYLADVRTSITATRNASDPYLALPDGRALVASTFADASGGLSTLQFGGNAGMNSDMRSYRWESMATLQLYPPGFATHRVKLAADARFDAYSQQIGSNTLGSYTYASLADLAANRPASFTRTLDTPRRTGAEWNAFASVGDLWRVNPQWQLMYGLRAEGNVFTKTPTLNPALSTLGVRNDHAPNTIALSPRLGVTWQDGAGKIVRAGVGQFRNLADAALLAAPSVTTGLPGGLTRISCIGSAVPTPDWSAFELDPSAIPRQCVGSTGGLADASPNVQYVDPSFQPTRSWRANLGYQTSAFRNIYSIDLVASWNLNQPGLVDRNFSGTPAFTLGSEGRPVFVSPSSIVPGTGVLSPVGARRSPSFGRVVDVVSDLRSQASQAIVTVRPYIPATIRPYFGDIAFTYTLSDIRAQQRGFDGAALGDPGLAEWARGDLDARHMLVAQWVVRPMGDGRLIAFMYARAQSGLPYTPMVAGDINGDGLSNDRAFVFDPSRRDADPSASLGMANLLQSASARVKDCLVSQMGHIAARNSCEGPWTTTMNVGLRMNGQTLLHVPRMDVTLNLTNPLGGLDQLLHGANDLHGWGTPLTPDRTLFTVTGFDPARNQFADAVNPRFGSTQPSLSTIRAPFRLTLDVQLDIARSMPEQQLDRWLRPGRAGRPGPKVTAADFLRRYQRTVPDPFGELLQQTDSLLLSPEQITRLQAVRVAYRARVDAMWTELSTYLVGLPDTYDFDAVARRTDRTIDDIWEITRVEVQRNYAEILAPAQTALLTGWSNQLFQARDRVHVRLSPRGG